MAHSSTVLSQLLKLVPRHEFERLANQCDGRRRSDALSRWSQFVAMSVAHIGGRQSLRDIDGVLKAERHKHYHLGTQVASRSTLARCNEQLDYEFFSKLFGVLYQRASSATPGHGFRFKSKLFSLDGSLLDASAKVFPWADYNRMKSAFKLHVGLDHDGLIPAFASVTLGHASEVEQARTFAFPRGSVVVFDKGYSNYSWHKALTEQGIYWVSRIRGNARYRVVERRTVPAGSAVTSDQSIVYTSMRAQGMELFPVRRVGYRDPETGKHYVFVTNQFKWSAETIAAIYKQRWQVELFFKWIKQNLKIKSFLGASKNAVLTQVLIALCVYLLLALLKFKSDIRLSMQQIVRLLQFNLFARRGLRSLLQPEKHKPPAPSPQLSLGLIRD